MSDGSTAGNKPIALVTGGEQALAARLQRH